MELHGLLSALATPFTHDGAQVDEPRLRELIERTITGRVHGIVPNGSTGEFTALSPEERRHVVEVTIDQVAGRIPVVPHIGAMTPSEAIALGRHAETSGASGVMLVAPYYEPLDTMEVMDFYRRVAGSLSIPVMIYNLPVATGVNLLPAQVAQLASEVDTIQYVKDTTGDLSQAAELIHGYGDVVKTFVGQDTLYFTALVEGSAGSVNGAANIIASPLVAVYDQVKAGQLAAARTTWESVYPVMKFLVSGGYVSGVKAALDVAGYSIGDPRLPIHPASSERRAEIEAALKHLAAS